MTMRAGRDEILVPRTPHDDLSCQIDECIECEVPATEYCVLCGALCQQCSSKLHAHKALSAHKVVPIEAKASLLQPVCEGHGDKAVLYCVECSMMICMVCKAYGAHKDHSGVMDLSEAAAKKVSELRQLIERATAAQRLEQHITAIMEAQESMNEEACLARAKVHSYFESAVKAFKDREREMLRTINEREVEMDLAFTAQRFEVAKARSALKAVVAQAEKVCEGSKPQILQAPSIVFPAVSLLSGPCFSSVEFPLSLPDLPTQSVSVQSVSCTTTVPIGQIEDEDDEDSGDDEDCDEVKAADKPPLPNAAPDVAPPAVATPPPAAPGMASPAAPGVASPVVVSPAAPPDVVSAASSAGVAPVAPAGVTPAAAASVAPAVVSPAAAGVALAGVAPAAAAGVAPAAAAAGVVSPAPPGVVPAAPSSPAPASSPVAPPAAKAVPPTPPPSPIAIPVRVAPSSPPAAPAKAVAVEKAGAPKAEAPKAAPKK